MNTPNSEKDALRKLLGDTAYTLDIVTSKLPANDPEFIEAQQRAKKLVRRLYAVERLIKKPTPSKTDVLHFAAQVIEMYDAASIESADYMLTAADCAEILTALAEYMETSDVRT